MKRLRTCARFLRGLWVDPRTGAAGYGAVSCLHAALGRRIPERRRFRAGGWPLQSSCTTRALPVVRADDCSYGGAPERAPAEWVFGRPWPCPFAPCPHGTRTVSRSCGQGDCIGSGQSRSKPGLAPAFLRARSASSSSPRAGASWPMHSASATWSDALMIARRH